MTKPYIEITANILPSMAGNKQCTTTDFLINPTFESNLKIGSQHLNLVYATPWKSLKELRNYKRKLFLCPPQK